MAKNTLYQNALAAALSKKGMYRDFTGGANNALASTLGAPVDLVNRYTVNQPNALFGSDWIRNKMNGIGIGTQGQGIAAIGGGLLGSMVLPGSGLLNAIDASAQIAQAQTPGQMMLAAGSGLLGPAVGALSKPRVMQEMTTYHGSPHDFNEFRMDKVGTGEGKQAYGHGLYFAENPGVAKSYQSALTTPVSTDVMINGSSLNLNDPVHYATFLKSSFKKAIKDSELIDELQFKLNHAGTLGENPDLIKKAIAVVKEGRLGVTTTASKAGGKLYHVDIPDSAINNMLDWDKPLSEQPLSVRQGFMRALGKRPDFDPSAVTGAQAYDMLAGGATGLHGYEAIAAEASRKLAKHGVPGIRYLDGGSRGSGNGTRNFVVFDDKLVKVLKKE